MPLPRSHLRSAGSWWAITFLAACSETSAPEDLPKAVAAPDSGVAIVEADAGADAAPPAPRKTTPALLGDGGEGFYPRAIQLADGTILASVVSPQASGRLGATIYESTDDALTFHAVGHVDDTLAAGGLCCGTLYELPRAIGTTAPGTLLWSASVGGNKPDAPMQIPIWASSDRGRTWTRWSTLATATKPRSGGGLWEPEFHVIDSGALVAHYSDETDPSHSQKLVAVQTLDGTNWVQRKDTVALASAALRPGMAAVRRMSRGTFVMSYEICAQPNDSCTAHLRFSSDGWDWGDRTQTGTRPITLQGVHVRHAPTLAFSAAPGSNGRLWLVGQMVYDFGGNVAPENGSVIFGNTEGGVGSWYPVPAPVPIPNPTDNFCPNYSSLILPIDQGKVALEIASRPEGGKCRAYFARGPLLGTGDSEGIAANVPVALASLQSGKCLEVAGGATTSGAGIVQSTCSTLANQTWTPVPAAEGSYALHVSHSGMCLGVASEAKAGVKLVQQPCDANANTQRWSFRNVGMGHYAMRHFTSGLCADVEGGAKDQGAAIQLWSCNDLAPQIWQLTKR